MSNNTLSSIVSETGIPIIHELQNTGNFEKYINRLEFLLWGNTNKYKGPLADGFETYEWISISLLLSDWLVETIVDAQHLTSQIVIDEIRKNPGEIAEFTIELLTKLIERDVIKVPNKNEVLLFLQNEIVVNTLVSHADDLLNILEKLITITCGFCKKTNKIQKISEKDGVKAYNANRALMKK